MRPTFITFTGIDARTDMEGVAALSSRYPCEWGILFSRNRQGLDNRYPAMDVVHHALSFPVKFAAHICGKYAQQIMDRAFDRTELPLNRFGRIQVNHTQPLTEVLADFAEQGEASIIAQWRDSGGFPENYRGVAWLYDPSGGTGMSPDSWPRNPSPKMVGYAGGISPDNAKAINRTVSELSQSYWLDMESGVRKDDWLDLDKCEAVLKAVYG